MSYLWRWCFEGEEGGGAERGVWEASDPADGGS